MGRRGRSARWGRTSAGCSSGGPALGWVAMAAPGRVVLWPAVAGLPCRRRRGWGPYLDPAPRCGVFSLVGGLIARLLASQAKGDRSGAARSQAPGLMRSSPLQPGSLLLIGDRSTTGSSGIPQRRQLHPREWRLSSRVMWAAARPSPDYESGGWGFESLAARQQTRSSAALQLGCWRCRIARTATKLRPRWRAVLRRLRPPATTCDHNGLAMGRSSWLPRVQGRISGTRRVWRTAS
jgi:hypothetical protein